MTKIKFFLLFILILLVSNIVIADYYYEPMNFDEPTNHTFNINLEGIVNVTIPSGFTLISGNLTGTDNVSFVIQSPDLNSTSPQLFVGTINLNSTEYAIFHLLSVDDSKIVDTKVEIGHGDFNYIDSDGFIGTDNTLLFNLVRVWAMGSDVIGEVATNVRFNCTYPLIMPNTVDSKYTTTYGTDIIAEGNLMRMEGISMFRIFVLSQEVEQIANTNYEVNCDKLYYDFTHTKVIADIEDFNLSVRDTNPLIISMTNNSEYVSYSIMNNESYDLRNLEFLWTIGTHTIREELNSLDAGEIVQYNIQTNASGEIDFKVRFIPEWMFNSRSPTFYEQTSFNTYNTPEFLDGLDTSSLYSNQSVLTTPILETQIMDFSISILDTPPFGGAYKVTYLFYENGVLIDSVERQIIGTQDHTISFSDTDLVPIGVESDYQVYTIVSIYDENGDWYDFDQEFIGVQTIAHLNDNGARQQVGLYDVIVSSRYDRFEFNDKIVADILIKNTGDLPDEDTVLTYYLISPDGKKFGETREQILEVPVGETLLTRSITLPVGAEKGHWEFRTEYETVVQKKIEVYDSFEVVSGMSILDRADLNINTFSQYGWVIIWVFILALMFISVFVVKRKKKSKK